MNKCVCVCVCVSAWNISADQDQIDVRFSTWLLHGLRLYNIGFVWTTKIPLNKLFHKYFTNSTSIVNRSHHGHVRTRANHFTPWPRAHQSQSLQSPLPQHTLRNKQIYTCSGTSWTGILLVVLSRSVHLNWLWINETKRVWTESVRVWGDPDTRGQQTGSESVDVRV